MPEYITKEQAIDEVWDAFTSRDDPDLGRVIEENIERLPAADVVEIVRCEDCVYYKPHTQGSGQCRNWGAINDTTTLFIVKRDNYCFMGKREWEYI